MLNDNERVAVLEVEVETLKEEILSMDEKLDILIENMHKTKGFWAGAVAAGTALGAALSYLISYIFNVKAG